MHAVRTSQSAVSRILFPPPPLRTTTDDDHSSSPIIAERVQQPTREPHTGRVNRSPIWPCSVRGFACRRCCHRRGALLPHLFTIACLAASAVYFLCHCPSGRPDRPLTGALPCGVRTFLPPSPACANCGGRSSGALRPHHYRTRHPHQAPTTQHPTQHPPLSTQHPALSTQHPALSTQHPAPAQTSIRS